MFNVLKQHKNEKLDMTAEELVMLVLATGSTLYHHGEIDEEEQCKVSAVLDATLSAWFKDKEGCKKAIQHSREAYEFSEKALKMLKEMKSELKKSHMQTKLDEILEIIKNQE